MRACVVGLAILPGLVGLAGAQAPQPGSGNAPAVTASVATPGAPAAPAPAGARVGGGGPNPAPARGPSLAVALELAQKALAACQADKLYVSATVVDAGGFVKVSLMDDNARSMTPTFGARKARTALEFKSSSGEVAAKAAAGDEAIKTRLATNTELFAAAGAVLLKAGNDIVGALAVSGARSEQDEACALAALDQMRERIK